jgi:hypothetical protein
VPIDAKGRKVRLTFQGSSREVELEVEVSTTFKKIAQKISSALFGTSHPELDLVFRQQRYVIQLDDRVGSFSPSNWPIQVRLHLTVRYGGGSP